MQSANQVLPLPVDYSPYNRPPLDFTSDFAALEVAHKRELALREIAVGRALRSFTLKCSVGIILVLLALLVAVKL